MGENLGVLGFTMWQILEKIKGTDKVGVLLINVKIWDSHSQNGGSAWW